MKMVQDTKIPSHSSDLLGTFSSLNEHGTASSPSCFPTQATRAFLFTSVRPALPSDQFSWEEVSCCPVPVIRALQSHTLQKSCWKCQENPGWLRTTLELWLNSWFLWVNPAVNLLQHDHCQGASLQRALLGVCGNLHPPFSLSKHKWWGHSPQEQSSPSPGLPFSLPERIKLNLYSLNCLCRQPILHNASSVHSKYL